MKKMKRIRIAVLVIIVITILISAINCFNKMDQHDFTLTYQETREDGWFIYRYHGHGNGMINARSDYNGSDSGLFSYYVRPSFISSFPFRIIEYISGHSECEGTLQVILRQKDADLLVSVQPDGKEDISFGRTEMAGRGRSFSSMTFEQTVVESENGVKHIILENSNAEIINIYLTFD